MDGMRDVLKDSLSRALRSLQEEDLAAVAWTVTCGRVMAERSTVSSFDNGILRVEVADGAWLRQLNSMKSQLEAELARIANVKVKAIHFELKRLPRESTGHE